MADYYYKNDFLSYIKLDVFYKMTIAGLLADHFHQEGDIFSKGKTM